MFISYFKNSIFKFFEDKYNYILTLALLFLIIVVYYIDGYSLFGYEILSIAFVMMILLITLKIKIGNKVLMWLGKNTFNIYILQRLSYIIYDKLGLSNYNVYI